MTKPDDAQARSERMRELGRKSGERRRQRAAERRSRGFLDVLKRRVHANPEELVEGLMSSAAGSVVAARVLERAGELHPKYVPPDPSEVAARSTSLFGVVELAYRTGQAAQFGLPTTHAELDALLAEGEAGAPVDPDLRDVASSGSGDGNPPPVDEHSKTGPPSTEKPSPGSHRPTNTKKSDAEKSWIRQQAEAYAREREVLGLEPDTGPEIKRPRRDRYVQPEMLEWEL